jgi:hypothetical protein
MPRTYSSVLVRPQQHEREDRDREARDEAEPEVELAGRAYSISSSRMPDDRAEDDEDDRDLHQLVLIAQPAEEAVQREADGRRLRLAGLLEDQEEEEGDHEDRGDDRDERVRAGLRRGRAAGCFADFAERWRGGAVCVSVMTSPCASADAGAVVDARQPASHHRCDQLL